MIGESFATQKVVELTTIATVTVFASVPWHNITFMPPSLMLAVAIGAGLAVVCIPDDRRSVKLSVVTALAGIGIGLLFTDFAVEQLAIESASAAKAVAGLLGFGGLPFAGMLLKLIDSASNNPGNWLGSIVRKFLPPEKPKDQPESGRAVPPQ